MLNPTAARLHRKRDCLNINHATASCLKRLCQVMVNFASSGSIHATDASAVMLRTVLARGPETTCCDAASGSSQAGSRNYQDTVSIYNGALTIYICCPNVGLSPGFGQSALPRMSSLKLQNIIIDCVEQRPNRTSNKFVACCADPGDNKCQLAPLEGCR